MRVVLRIRTGPGKLIVRSRRPNRRLAELGAALLWPLAGFCLLLCFWRWSYDVSWAERFPFPDGVLSHWQIWFVAGGLLHLTAVRLRRYAGDSGAISAATVVQEPPQAQIP